VPSGSYLVVSHPASDVSDVANQATARYNELVATGMTRRSREEFEAFFDGLELVEPGVVHPADWRSGPDDALEGEPSPAYCAVGRKP
jgi:hypothetical protein